MISFNSNSSINTENLTFENIFDNIPTEVKDENATSTNIGQTSLLKNVSSYRITYCSSTIFKIFERFWFTPYQSDNQITISSRHSNKSIKIGGYMVSKNLVKVF
ncbi:MAG: hypothetical protein AB7V56_06735 [Candidatus Nitrosocosmicus sp.]|nr:hypothetical protein [Candidatus Nitrosocosmicus sp.]